MDTTDIEKKSLEAHVELCAERYRTLELQMNTVKQDVEDVKGIVNETHSLVHSMFDKRNNQVIGWAVAIIGGLFGVISWLITHYILK